MMGQMTVLLWKEWRELRLTFAVLALLNVPMAAGFGLFGAKEYGVAMLYYCVAVAWLLGAAAAGGEQVTGRSGFMTANPVHLRLLWLSKLVVGLCCTLVFIVLSYGLMWCVCPAHEVVSVEALSFSAPALCFFCLSHYHACWVRSAVTAMGLGLLSGGALQALLLMMPLGMSPVSGLAFGVVALAALLSLASRQFVRAVSLGGQLDRSRYVVWSLLPILLLGVLPFAVGHAVGAIQEVLFAPEHVPFQPVHTSHFHALCEAPGGGRLLAFAGVGVGGRQVCGLPGEQLPFAWDTVAVSAPVRGPGSCSTRRLSGDFHLVSDSSSPDGTHVVALLRGPSTRAAVLDVDSGSYGLLPSGARPELHIWLSDQQLAFVHCASDRQWQWGVWDALTREVTYYQPPSVLDRAALRPLGWLQNPPRLVLCSNFPSPPNPEVVLLDIHSHHVERVGIDQGHHCALLFHECERVLCVPDRRTSDAAPYLADLASGKALDFSGRMLRTPPRGWHRHGFVRTRGAPWLLILPSERGAQFTSDWYAVNAADLQVCRHEAPVPRPDQRGIRWASESGWLVSMAHLPGGRARTRLVLHQLREPHPTQRLVVMKPGKPGHVSCLAMLADDKLAFCTSLSPSYRHDRGAVVPNPTPPSIRIADLAERQIRMLWPRRRSVTDWRIVTWSEREIRN